MLAGGQTKLGSNTAQVVWTVTVWYCTHTSEKTGTVLYESHTCVVPVCWFWYCVHTSMNTGTC